MAQYWIVSSKHSRDEGTENWDSKWTANTFVQSKRFFPSRKKRDFGIGDKCILKVFGDQEFIADFEIASEPLEDDDQDICYELSLISEWDFPVDEHSLPDQYTDLLSRSPTTLIDQKTYFELIGIKNFTQNLRFGYKNKLNVKLSENDLENILDSAQNPLKSIGLQIVERQKELSRGNIIDLICKDGRGDLVVIELKKRGANSTVGQLARYLTDVREKMAKPTQRTRGLILSFEIDEQLIKAARGADFDVMLYQITVG
ncbi:endonuclease NucS domain-containing protein [Elusimicrobiota bacterium]